LRPSFKEGGEVLGKEPEDKAKKEAGETLEEYVRRYNIRRSGVNPRTQMFKEGGEVLAKSLRTKQKKKPCKCF
jgi:hypothetical protein